MERVEEFGTYFIGYAATPDVTEEMLRHMFLGDPPGNTDRVLDFSTAVTGTLFFVPTADFLDDLPPAPGLVGSTTATADADALEVAAEPGGAAPTTPGTAARTDGSLTIGDLKGQSGGAGLP